eukprot:CAMPEP_0177660614 /NCGR_PEP_ID=MMETSP0447-20121125/18147_1 /TAXON_ID=0 /ORGANISM="Stygamoeba regulata, Strain BSH-02190019" /LENGTH=337 /DNA_ID=CAMNT_0019165717 /DNA_START=23 /DNA_END=1036 /DNA_ORIENTATION=-
MKVAIVTGGTKGIGLGIASELASKGYNLVVGFLSDEDAAKAAYTELQSRNPNGQVHMVKGDVSDPKILTEFFAIVKEKFDSCLTAVIHNAGGRHIQKIPGITNFDDYDYAQEIYPKFFTRMVEESLKHFKDGEGRVVALSSQGVHTPSPTFAFGAAAKAAMEVMARHYAFALAPRGITVNVVVPGFVKTPAWTPILKQTNFDGTPAVVTPMGRWGMPTDIAPLVSFLCSPEACWITGQIIQIDGGFGMSLFESVSIVGAQTAQDTAAAGHAHAGEHTPSGGSRRRGTLSDKEKPKETLRQQLERLAKQGANASKDEIMKTLNRASQHSLEDAEQAGK